MSSEVTAEKAKNAKYEQEIEDLRSHVAELEKQGKSLRTHLRNVQFVLGEDEKNRGLRIGQLKRLSEMELLRTDDDDVDEEKSEDISPQQTIALLLERFAETSADLKREEKRKRLAEENRDAMERSLRKIEKTLASLTQKNRILQGRCDVVTRDRSESESRLKIKTVQVRELMKKTQSLSKENEELKRGSTQSKSESQKQLKELLEKIRLLSEKNDEMKRLSEESEKRIERLSEENDALKRGSTQSSSESERQLKELLEKIQRLSERNDALSYLDMKSKQKLKDFEERIQNLGKEKENIESQYHELKRLNMKTRSESRKQLVQEREKAKEEIDRNNVEMRKQLEEEKHQIYQEARRELKMERKKIETKKKKLKELVDNQRKAMEMVARAERKAKEQAERLKERKLTEHKSEYEALKASAMMLKRNITAVLSSSDEENELSQEMSVLMESIRGTQSTLTSQAQDAKDRAAEARKKLSFEPDYEISNDVFKSASQVFARGKSDALSIRLCEIRVDIINAFEACQQSVN